MLLPSGDCSLANIADDEDVCHEMTRNTVALILPQPLDNTAGGVQRSTWQMGHYLSSKDWNVIYISLASCGNRQPLAGHLCFPDHELPPEGNEQRVFLKKVLDEFKPDVVVNQIGVAPEPMKTLWALRGQGARFRIVSCFRNNPAFFRDNHRHVVKNALSRHDWLRVCVDNPLGWSVIVALHRWKNRKLFDQAFSNCDRFMLLSPTFFDELRWYLPDLNESKLLAIPNGFVMPQTNSKEKKLNRLLFVGRLENGQKNVLMLADLWARLQTRLPDWELHIVGDGDDRRALAARIAELGLERVFLHGKQDPTEHYRDARIFLMLSAFEGFGNTLIEAQMHGVVPVAFRSYSAIDWMLNDNEDAVLVAPFDLDCYADEVERLATDDRRLGSMSASARDNAKRFSEEVIGQQWHDLLENLVQERSGHTARVVI